MFSDVRAIAAKLDRMDVGGRADVIGRDFDDLQGKIKDTKELLRAADVEVKVGDEAKELVQLLKGIERKLELIDERLEQVENKCCTVSYSGGWERRRRIEVQAFRTQFSLGYCLKLLTLNETKL